MKSRKQINAAFNASLRAMVSLSEEAESPKAKDAAKHYRDMSELLAWVLDFRDYPGVDRTDRFFNRLISADEQSLSEPQ